MRNTNLFLSIVVFCLIGCLSSSNIGEIKKSIDEYQAIADYIINQNLHNGFRDYKIIDLQSIKEKDSTLFSFMVDKEIKLVYVYAGEGMETYNSQIYKDSVIEFYFWSPPYIGKKSSLIFDYSSTRLKPGAPWENNKHYHIIKEGVYYIK